jgi:hypothetical protein
MLEVLLWTEANRGNNEPGVAIDLVTFDTNDLVAADITFTAVA